MDLRTTQTLALIKRHLRIRRYLTVLCYVLIAAGVFVYFFIAFVKNSEKYKLVVDYTKNPSHYQTEKIMLNPRINFQFNENEVYIIKAERASHKTEEEIMMYDVFATGQMGSITAGELKVSEKGDRLVFTKNPVLILNK